MDIDLHKTTEIQKAADYYNDPPDEPESYPEDDVIIDYNELKVEIIETIIKNDLTYTPLRASSLTDLIMKKVDSFIKEHII